MVHKHWSTYIVHCKWSVLMDTVNYITIFLRITFLFSVVDLQTRHACRLLCIHRNCWSSWSFCRLCMPLHRTLYHTLLDGRANFVYFYWPLWRGSVIIYLCILWRFLVTWVHADVLTTPLMRKLCWYRGLDLPHLILWWFPRMFSGFALFPLRCQVVHLHQRYHRQVVTLHRWMWEQWLLRSVSWIYSYSLPLYLYRCVSSAWRYGIVFHKFFILATRLRGMCIRDAKFAPCVDLTITSSVSHFATSGTRNGFLLSSLLAAVNMTRSLLHWTRSTVHQVEYVKFLGFYCGRIVFDWVSILNPSSFVDFSVVSVVLEFL